MPLPRAGKLEGKFAQNWPAPLCPDTICPMLHLRALATPLLATFALIGCADPFVESTALLGDTADTTGPYEVRSIVIGAHPSDKIEVFYNATDRDPDRYIPIVMEGQDDDGRSAELFVGSIPGHPAGSTIRYYIAVDRDGERVAEDPVGGDLRPYILSIAP